MNIFNFKSGNRGLIKFIVLIIIAIVILSYFGFNLREIVESPESQGNLGYVWGLVVSVWDNYLARPLRYLWNDIFVDILWAGFISNMERLRDGQPTDIELAAPTI